MLREAPPNGVYMVYWAKCDRPVPKVPNTRAKTEQNSFFRESATLVAAKTLFFE